MSTFFTLLPSLICAHLLIDFYLQPDQWVKDKNKHKAKSSKLILHSVLHGLLVSVCVAFIESEWSYLLGVFALVTVSHWFIDLAKICLGNSFKLFALDQFLHLCVLLIVAVSVSNITIDYNVLAIALLSQENIAIVLAYLIVLKPVSIAISLVLQNLTLDQDKNKGLVAGGEIIGYVERILILTFILIGQYAVVGFVLAAKSIFRFGELNKSDNLGLTEYVLLGSLLSVTMTSMIGIFLMVFVFSNF